MFCKNCGNQLKETTNFCAKCGAKVERRADQTGFPINNANIPQNVQTQFQQQHFVNQQPDQNSSMGTPNDASIMTAQKSKFKTPLIAIGGCLGLIIIVVFLIAFIPSLFSSDINSVKGGTLSYDETTTVGKALDNYKYFSKTNWNSFESEQGRKVVEFTGEIDNGLLKNSCKSYMDNILPEISTKEKEKPYNELHKNCLLRDRDCKNLKEMCEEAKQKYREIEHDYCLATKDQDEFGNCGDLNADELVKARLHVMDICRPGDISQWDDNIDRIEETCFFRDNDCESEKEALDKAEYKKEINKVLLDSAKNGCNLNSAKIKIQFLMHTNSDSFEVGSQKEHVMCNNDGKIEDSKVDYDFEIEKIYENKEPYISGAECL